MNNIFQAMSSASVIGRATGALGRVLNREGAQGAIRFVKKMNVLIKCGALFMAVICLVAASAIAIATNYQVSQPQLVLPEAAGVPPRNQVILETDLVTETERFDIEAALTRLSKEFHFHVALYCSEAPAPDLDPLYYENFQDELGLLVYLSDYEDYGEISYYVGSALKDSLTEEFLVNITSRLDFDLNRFTQDRAQNIVSDLAQALRTLSSSHENSIFNYLAAVFWIVMSAIFYFAIDRIGHGIIGIPANKKVRKQLLYALEQQINNSEGSTSPL